jgi:hypothetical protein
MQQSLDLALSRATTGLRMEVNHAKARKEKSPGPDGSPKAGGNNVKQRCNDDAGKEHGK